MTGEHRDASCYNPIAMPEIRPAREDELDRVHFIAAYSFTGDRSQEGRERGRHIEELGPATVLLEDGEIVAALKVYPFTMLVNGAPIGMGGVSGVSCLPEARRKGHVGALLRYVLAEMRDRGQPLSALYTPHPALYRKYGYMVAAANLKFSFHPQARRPVHSGGHTGARRANYRGAATHRRGDLWALQRGAYGAANPQSTLVEGSLLPPDL